MEKLVKVGKMPGRITEVVVEGDMTIGQVLNLAGLDSEGHTIKVDGEVRTKDDLVGDANLIVLSQMIKGNSEGLVKVGKMPGRIIEVVASPDMTIRELLTLAELDSQGHTIKVDGEVKTEDDLVGNANLVVLSQMIKGN